MSRPFSLLHGLRARPRLVGCAVAGAVVGFGGAAMGHSAATMVLVGWNAGALVYLFLAWRSTVASTVEHIRGRAATQDEGRHAILVLVVLAASAVLLAVGTQLAQVKNLHGSTRTLHLALAGMTVVTSWLFTQVLFALHYAHAFYMARVRGEADPLDFPGTADPDYADFFHFACVIGTSAQTADISFHGSSLRPVGTLHCMVAFFFNATLLALSINLAAGLLL